MVCKEHKELIEKINSLCVDMAVIKNVLVGENSIFEKTIDKVEKHDMYFYIAYGMIILLGFAIANIGVYIK